MILIKHNSFHFILDSEETSLLAVLLVLPFLFSPASSKRKKCNTVCWRPSKIEMRDGFILHIRSHVELQEAIPI